MGPVVESSRRTMQAGPSQTKEDKLRNQIGNWSPIERVRASGCWAAIAMAGMIKNLRVTQTGAGSKSLAEAQQRATDFFREACRALPSIMDRYNLYEIITLSELRTKIAFEFRRHHHNTNIKVIDMLVFKGREELQYCIDHSKQRHHLLTQYIVGREGLTGDVLKLGEAFKGESEFLKTFYRGNN